MKVVATVVRETSFYKNGYEVKMPIGSQYTVTDVKIGINSTRVELVLDTDTKRRGVSFNSVNFKFELVLGPTRDFEERRMEIDVVDDLMPLCRRDDLFSSREIYSNGMPKVRINYVLVS